VKAVLLDYPPYGPWDVEAEAARRNGAGFAVVDYEAFAASPDSADLLLNAGAWPLPAHLLDRVPACRCVAGYGVGLDFVDLADAGRRGLLVCNMPNANTEEVATHALALLLACARRLRELDATVRRGGFDWPRAQPLHRLRGRTLGLLAFGRIARRLAELAAPLGVELLAHDPFVGDEEIRRHGVEPVDLDALLRRSDVLSVHAPSTPETRGLLDAERLALLPAGAILVVTSRGDVYDADAVAAALASGRLAAAGLDVFPAEPLPSGHPLTRLDSAVLTPHVAGYSEESVADLHAAGAAILDALAAGGPVPGAVNPEVLR
jgi:D-3-phosphoglycerate dehydrogenase